MLEITSLPAKQGDAIWIRWGTKADPHQIIIDMGTEGIGRNIRQIVEALEEDQRKFDLLVITHVDADHLGGVLTCLAEQDPLPGFAFDDVWFNGFEHLNGGSITMGPGLEPMGPAQGEKLSNWLREQVWNQAFDGGPVRRVPGQIPPTIRMHDDLKMTILGPTPDRLNSFIDTWVEKVHDAIDKRNLDADIVSPGLEPMGSDTPPLLVLENDLRDLAESNIKSDTSKANGSSISLLLEYKGRKLILSGDAFSDDLVDGITAVSPNTRLRLDVFKLPHHGSKKNVHKELIESVDCDNWLISTDGTRFKHPDAEAIARVICFSRDPKPLLSFNVPSTFNGWWKKTAWKNMYDYDVECGTAEDGLTLQFDLDD